MWLRAYLRYKKQKSVMKMPILWCNFLLFGAKYGQKDRCTLRKTQIKSKQSHLQSKATHKARRRNSNKRNYQV